MPFLVGNKQLINILSINVALLMHILFGFCIEDTGHSERVTLPPPPKKKILYQYARHFLSDLY